MPIPTHRSSRPRGPMVFLLLALALPACGGTDDSTAAAKHDGAGKLYYSSTDDGFIYALDLASGDNEKLIFGNEPYRTKEGTFLYVDGSDLAESSDGVQVRTIIPSNPDIPTFDDGFHNPRPSPDGTLVAYSTNQDLVFVCRRDNGQIVSNFPMPQGSTVGYERPTWTPDGRIVVAGEFSNPGLYVSDAAFTTLTRFDPMLDQPSLPSVSPKGDMVAFIANDHVFTIHLDGSGLTQITDGNQTESFPDWSPDGKELGAWQAAHFIVGAPDGTHQTRTDESFPDELYRMNTDQQFSLR